MGKRLAVVALTAVLGASLIGCTLDNGGPGLENRTPTVWLSSAPPEGTVSSYTLHLYWGGWDPDGEIRYFEYSITNNDTGVFDPADTTGADKWHRVSRNDSTFTFTADQVADSTSLDPYHLFPVDFIRSHTFFIRAVDDRGEASAKPAYRSFTSRTLSPVVHITVPIATGKNPAQVPPISTFEWRGEDYVNNDREVQDPDSVRWILVPLKQFKEDWDTTIAYVRRNPKAPEWSAWYYYRAPQDSFKSWTTPVLEFGRYVFAVQVKDEAGAISAVFDENSNVRRIQVTPRTTGPTLTVFNRYIGTIVTANPNTAPTIIDLPSNVDMEFTLTADARSYGGVAVGYRYGWDIEDLNDPLQWDVSYTPFLRFRNGVPFAQTPSRAWQFDSHIFYIEVMDNSGYTSRLPIRVNVVPFTMERSVLIVDDWKENNPGGFAQSNGGLPSDEEHDEFWLDMVSEVSGFDPAIDVLELDRDIPITALSRYKAAIWVASGSHNSTSGSVLSRVIQFVDPNLTASTGKSTPNIVALFMNAGGHVLLVGSQVMTMAINRTSFGFRNPAFPIIFRYELGNDQDGEYEDSDIGVKGVAEESFAYSDCCLNVLDVAVRALRLVIRRTAAGHVCPVNVIRAYSPLDGRNDGLRVARPMGEKYVFPTLNLRFDVAGPGRWYSPEVQGLNADLYNPIYFKDVRKDPAETATCNDLAELDPPRSCFKPVYGNGCLNQLSPVYDAPVACWSTTFENRIPDVGGVGARSMFMGFHLVYFNPSEAQQAMDIILFDEWKLARREPQ